MLSCSQPTAVARKAGLCCGVAVAFGFVVGLAGRMRASTRDPWIGYYPASLGTGKGQKWGPLVVLQIEGRTEGC